MTKSKEKSNGKRSSTKNKSTPLSEQKVEYNIRIECIRIDTGRPIGWFTKTGKTKEEVIKALLDHTGYLNGLKDKT